MAIIISYPNATSVSLSDKLLGTQLNTTTKKNATKNFNISSIVNLTKETIMPYNVYTAFLSQVGESNPVATVLQNTLGLNITWTRGSTGRYIGTNSIGEFEQSKCWFNTTLSPYCQPFYSYLDISESNSSTLELWTFDVDNQIDLDGRIFIEIKIYN